MIHEPLILALGESGTTDAGCMVLEGVRGVGVAMDKVCPDLLNLCPFFFIVRSRIDVKHWGFIVHAHDIIHATV